MVDQGATEIEVSNLSRETVIKAVKETLRDNTGSRVITQDLKSFDRIVHKGSGESVKVANGQNPTTLYIGELSKGEKKELWERIGDDNIWVASTISTRDEISSDAGSTDTVSNRDYNRDTTGDWQEEDSGRNKGEVHKPYDHQDAGYVSPESSEYDTTHQNCDDCAHYDNHGNCRIVSDIEPDGYCTKHYADVGFFASGASIDQEPASLVDVFWGEDHAKRLEGSTAGAIVQDIKEAFKEKLGERYVQFIE